MKQIDLRKFSTQPVVVSNDQAMEKEYIFYEQVSATKKLFTSIAKDWEETLKELKNEKKEPKGNYLISLIGERGTGKSSLLYTIKNVFEKENSLVLDIIDPGMFADEVPLIELVLSSILKNIEKVENNVNDEKFINLFNKIKNATETLGTVRISSNDAISKYTTCEVLDEYKESINFKTILFEIARDTIDLINEGMNKEYKTISILIDDLDLVSNIKIYQMLEDLRKYISSCFIVVIAYREKQLRDSVLQNIVLENNPLINYSKNDSLIKTNELFDQTSKYIEKLSPLATQVFLYNENELHHKPMKKILSSLKDDKSDVNNEMLKKILEEEETLEKWYYSFLRNHILLDLQPVDPREINEYTLPNNLRAVMDYLQFAIRMEDFVGEKDIAKRVRIVLNNIKIYDEYCSGRYSKIFSANLMDIIKNWELASIDTKNYKLYRSIYYLCNNLSSEDETAKQLSEIYENNIKIKA
ncbi:hypothetical protein EDD63_1881 [Breznakia blatticola]|uniref:KAP-like P-loop domain-containing protein n=1 Tax=Breznakia blatticola TaxID=1754012 RepID=A0A4R7ZB46_9FIRM|nr:hypothetical protein [Breznakia blatticola]TDW07421.1 hypothetical protein EDD63_1881 [Breznakia blatticola]